MAADAFIDRGVAYAKLKQFEKAIQDYNQAIELDPEDTYALKHGHPLGLIQ
jgi:Flp pilus assembly protein TadD